MIENIKDNQEDKNQYKNKVHKILAYSYMVYFFSFLFGLLLDFLFPIKVYQSIDSMFVGIILIFLGTFLIIWAQRTSLNFKKDVLNKNSFLRGPYNYTRSPTHIGLFLLMLGFGFMSNTFFIISFSMISFLVTKFFFLKKEEEILLKKYGEAYAEYKKIVKI